MTVQPDVPDKPSLRGLEAKWSARWQRDGTYAFEPAGRPDDVFAIDTPPPTVSGSLHPGHVFSYTHPDILARYMRMRGKRVFYPMGWDDNGLPTERRVQNMFGVRCDPALPYEENLAVSRAAAGAVRPISRRNFIELCKEVTSEDEQVFENLFRMLGLSIDWKYLYATIDERSRRVAQTAFLRNLGRGEAYQADAPTLWDVDFQTAVAQAEVEDREVDGAYYKLAFDDLVVDTTRPELLPACVALVAHPSDSRYAGLSGRTVRTPLFGVEVPLLFHGVAEPDKGTGLAMVCTFGDMTDVIWWRDLRLPARTVIRRDGRMVDGDLPWIEDPAGRTSWAELSGMKVKAARTAIAARLAGAGLQLEKPRPIRHAVKFFEKGENPLEIVSSRQWYIGNGALDEELRARLQALGRELDWHPPFMAARYRHWVNGLNTDWLISRQRFFGVPIPLWYAVDTDGRIDYSTVLAPQEEDLPVDPAAETPRGYLPAQRATPGGFVADPDVMDTWATSSMSPQIAGGWLDRPELFAEIFPMVLRPQAHDIIRTWLFSTVLRSELEHGLLPWKSTLISGFVLDPDRKKISKSKGNATTPLPLLEEYGADAVRHAAARARPGRDAAFDATQVRVGARLATKILNASRFVLRLPHQSAAEVDHPVDRSLMAALAVLAGEVTSELERLDYATGLARLEQFFWAFCDDHIELVKDRAYVEAPTGDSARASLLGALSTQLRLFAPFMPYVTEEVWSWWHGDSIHLAPWPEASGPAQGDPRLIEIAGEVLHEVRRVKSELGLNQRAELVALNILVNGVDLPLARAAAGDLGSATHAREVVIGVAEVEHSTVRVDP